MIEGAELQGMIIIAHLSHMHVDIFQNVNPSFSTHSSILIGHSAVKKLHLSSCQNVLTTTVITCEMGSHYNQSHLMWLFTKIIS